MDSTVAVVENQALVALDIARSLERAGYGVMGPYGSGPEFIAALDAGTLPDLALMDITMDGMYDGIDAAARARRTHDIPSLFLTAHADDATIARAKMVQPLGYILKPFGERELLATVEIALYRAGMERRLSESERRYRMLFEDSMSARFICDPAGHVNEANATFRALFKAREPVSILDFFPDPGTWAELADRGSRGDFVQDEELRMRDGEGKELRVVAGLRLMEVGAGAEPRIQAEIVDQTERRRLQENLVQAGKMESMGRLAGGVAHDFNNVLTAVKGHAEMILMGGCLVGEGLEDLEGIRNAADRAAGITRQLLAFSRGGAWSPRVFDLNASLGEYSKMLKRLVGDAAQLSVLPGEGRLMVLADPVQVEQAVMNLVVNAKDALENRPDGRITVMSTARTLGEATTIGAEMIGAGAWAELEVADNGSGMSPEVAARVFEPFYTTKPEGKGTGLGLSIVHMVARQAGGAVDLVTGVGEGTVFRVWIPLAEGIPEDAAVGSVRGCAPQDAAPLPGRPGAKVLLVDEDEGVLLMMTRGLARSGYRATPARTPGEALLIAEREPFDLLVANMDLPLMSGETLAARLAGKQPGMAVLFVREEPESTAGGPVSGPLLEKPFTVSGMLRAVGQVLARGQHCREQPGQAPQA